MKNKGVIITLIILLSILSITLIYFMIYLLSGHQKFSFYQVSKELIIDEIIQEEIQKINITSSSSDIEIIENKDDNIRVIIYGEKDSLKKEINQKELNIQLTGKKCFGFCFTKTISKIQIYLPKNYASEIEIDNEYGDIKIGEFLDSHIKIMEDCGDVKIKGVKNTNIKNNYGDIQVETAKKVDIKASAGDIQIEKVEEAIIENDLGNIEINSATSYLNLSNHCGDIKIKSLTLNKDSIIKDDLGNIEIGFTNDLYIDAKTNLGDTKINRNNRNSDIILTIENHCGDIEIEN